MEYEVTLDFGDRTAPNVKTFTTASELSQHLERVPHLLGFEINGGVTITVKVVPATRPVVPLFSI